ncbi:MAG TPA: MCE family protein [Deltaproteobacteria bacterium]|jgi:phospholipid/cholesterol/gamma-HCH transport system substrate-binding protein|nr:MCE family protein [Deltaproteobacteria bacterium]
METKVNYAIVGAFVLILSAAIVAGVLWISSGRTARKNYDTYLAYFTESVSGLNVEAPVKYRGVQVGMVKEIALDKEDPQRVRLVLAIERGAPIKQDTVAILSVQGLTGIAFLDLEGGSRESPLLTPKEEEPYPVIATGPSFLRRLDTRANALIADLSQTAQSINELIDPETRSALQRTVRDIDSVTHVIAGRSKAIDATLENSARASADLTQLVKQVAQSAEAVERAAEKTARASEAVRATASDAGGGVDELRADTLPELQRLLADARVVMSSLRRIAQDLERNPNALVVGRELPPGPGE